MQKLFMNAQDRFKHKNRKSIQGDIINIESYFSQLKPKVGSILISKTPKNKMNKNNSMTTTNLRNANIKLAAPEQNLLYIPGQSIYVNFNIFGILINVLWIGFLIAVCLFIIYQSLKQYIIDNYRKKFIDKWTAKIDAWPISKYTKFK